MVTKTKEIRDGYGYKITALGEIPIDWEVRTTGELFENVSKKGYQELPVLSVTQDAGVVYREDLEINIKYDEKSLKSYKLIEPGQFVISLRSFQGGLEYSTLKGISSPAYTIIKPIVPIIDTYYKYLFKSFWFIDSLKSSIVGIRDGKQISYSDFKIIKVAVPPLKEQKKISEILSIVDEQIENTAELISKTKELKKGLMQQLLTKGIGHTEFKQTELGEVPIEWECKTIGELYTFQGGQQPPRKYFTSEYREGFIRLIQIRDYKTDKYMSYIPKQMAKKFCDETDIMIGRYGPPVFQILRGLAGSYNVALIKAIPDSSKLLKDYAYYFLCKEELFKLIDHLSQRSSGQTGVDMEALKNYPFPLPPIDEQQKIADILSTVDEQIDAYEKEKEKQIELRKGLMQQLLTGKVRVTV